MDDKCIWGSKPCNNLAFSLVFNLLQYPKLSDYKYMKNI